MNIKALIDFNKEILFGELGAVLSAPAMAYITSLLTQNTRTISALAVIGSIVGASLFWILMKIHDEKVRHIFSGRHLVKDIEYFTPAAFLCTLLFYYPTLFLFSRHLLTQDYKVVSSVIISQIAAFILFLAALNAYRYVLYNLKDIEL